MEAATLDGQSTARGGIGAMRKRGLSRRQARGWACHRHVAAGSHRASRTQPRSNSAASPLKTPVAPRSGHSGGSEAGACRVLATISAGIASSVLPTDLNIPVAQRP